MKLKVTMLRVLDDLQINKFTEVLNEIYNSGKIPEDFIRSITLTLLQKSGACKCELHWIISLMNHITKLKVKLLMNRAYQRIKGRIMWFCTMCWSKKGLYLSSEWVTYRKMEYMVVSKGDSLEYELHIGDVKIRLSGQWQKVWDKSSEKHRYKKDTFQ